jgi:hypothetical protein
MRAQPSRPVRESSTRGPTERSGRQADRQAPAAVHDALATPGTLPPPPGRGRGAGLRPSQVPIAPVPGTLTVGKADAAEEASADAEATSGVPVPAAHLRRPVQIHTGPAAERSAVLLGARAYALSGHIVFGPGQYDPGSPAGARLLAHEMHHATNEPSGSGVLRRATAHTDKDLFGKMQDFRSKNSQLTTEQQNHIFWSIKHATDSDEVAYAFFDYYSGVFGQKIQIADAAKDKELRDADRYADTKPDSDTYIRADALAFPEGQLGPLLLHEFSHTGQNDNWGGTRDYQEGMSYGVEYHYAEHMGNTARMTQIQAIIMTAAARFGAGQEAATKENFRVTYVLLKELDNLTATGSSTLPPLSGKGKDDGRLISAAFVEKYRSMGSDAQALWDYIKAHLSSFTYPAV